MPQLIQRYRDTSAHVIISVKDLPALCGRLTSVNESYSRERHIFTCVVATQDFVSVSFGLNSSVWNKELGYMPKSLVNNHSDAQLLATVFTVTVISLQDFTFNLHSPLIIRIGPLGTKHEDLDLTFKLALKHYSLFYHSKWSSLPQIKHLAL